MNKKIEENQINFHKKYRDEFNSFSEMIDLYDYMLDLCDCTKEKAFINLNKFFITKNKSIIKDYLVLVSLRMGEEKHQYLLNKFGINQVE